MKQLLLLLAASSTVLSASAFKADLDGTAFDIDTVYSHVVAPGVTQNKLLLTAPSRTISVYTSTLSRKAGATPGLVEPHVVIGKDQCLTAETVSSMAKRHSTTDRQLVTGINGDFFITSSFASQHEFGNAILGYPNMACAIDGMIAAPDMIDVVSRENALVIASDSWYIDATDFKYRLLNSDGSTVVDATAVNYPRRDAEMMVYNSYNGASTRTSSGRELTLRLAPGAEWAINKSVKFTVDGSWAEGGNSAIPSDGIVISCGPAYSNEWIDGLKDGDVVKLKIVVALPAHDKAKPDITHIIGGDVRILNQGNITREAIRWINTPSAKYQRSLVGFSEDRDMMVMAAVDGTGLTYYESAALMKALGCYDALDFDGGGSTAIWSHAFGTYNSPRDGSERAVGNALYFALNAPADSKVASIRFADHAAVLPKYGTYTPVIYGYNQYGLLVDTDMHGFTLTAPEGLGTTEGSSLMASGSGTHALTATLNGMTASIAVTVDDAVDAAPRHSSILIDDRKPVAIELLADVRGTAMPVDPAALTWTSSDPAVATVDALGFISGHADGTATITGIRGDLSLSISVVVECPVKPTLSILADAADWRSSGTGITVNSLTTTDAGALAVDFKVTSTRAAKMTLRRDALLWSRPDAIEVALEPGTASFTRMAINVVPANAKALTAEVTSFTEGENVFRFDIDKFIDTTDQGIYPLTLQSVVLTPASATGSFVTTINRLEAVYDGVEDAIAPIRADIPVLRPVVTEGHNIAIGFVADELILSDLSGRTVAHVAHASSVQAPGTGLYILTAASEGHPVSSKVIVK